MKELMEEIENAFKLISAISVNGDGVDVIAGARESLRKAYKIAKELNCSENAGEIKNG